jgi:hypothetical protein
MNQYRRASTTFVSARLASAFVLLNSKLRVRCCCALSLIPDLVRPKSVFVLEAAELFMQRLSIKILKIAINAESGCPDCT